MRVLFLPEVRDCFRELAAALYEKGYLGSEGAAVRYAEDLFGDIATGLPAKTKKPAPAHFSRYGDSMFYSVFRKNSRTQWYVFFTVHEKDGQAVYLVRHMSNNHMVAHFL